MVQKGNKTMEKVITDIDKLLYRGIRPGKEDWADVALENYASLKPGKPTLEELEAEAIERGITIRGQGSRWIRTEKCKGGIWEFQFSWNYDGADRETALSVALGYMAGVGILPFIPVPEALKI
jgi:hypothetical protein